ncbi:MAG: SCO family protein [Betaproteobacteria bacterium]|nr:SCO family protein [Betaproteobacteria bacterium]
MFEQAVEKFKSRPYFWSAIICMLVITILTPFTRRVPEPPPVIAEVPEFSVINQNGEAFGSKQLAGKAYVVSFIFTRCKTACPMIFQHLKTLQERIKVSSLPLNIVSFTVDPEHDTPETLKAHGATIPSDPAHWIFLTAEKAILTQIIEGGFMMAVGEASMMGGLMDIAHAQKLVLVDAKGKIRGFYDATPNGVDEVFSRAEAISGERFF